MTTRGDIALVKNLLAQSDGCCVRCGRSINSDSVRLVQLPVSRYLLPPSRVKIVAQTEPRCFRCTKYQPPR